MKLRKVLYVIIVAAIALSAVVVVFAVNSALSSQYITRGNISLEVPEPVIGLEFFITTADGAEFTEFIYNGTQENPLNPIITTKAQDGGVWIAVFSDYNGFGDTTRAVTLGTLVFDNRSNNLTVGISETAAYKLEEDRSLTRVSASVTFHAELPDADDNGRSGDGGGGGGGGGNDIPNEEPEESLPAEEFEDGSTDIYEPVTFSDLTEAEWARTAIEYLASRYGFSGMGNDLFAPNAELTRAQFARFTATVFGIEASDISTGYSDVGDGDWFAADVSALSSIGAIDGFPDGTFRPNELITREQMAAIIVRTATALGLELSPMRPFVLTDIAEAGDWSQDSIRALYRCGAIEGMADDRFEPHLHATRAQACMILYRMVKICELQ